MRKVATQVFNEQRAQRMAELGIERNSTEDGFFPQVETNLVASAEKRPCVINVGSSAKN